MRLGQVALPASLCALEPHHERGGAGELWAVF